MVKDCIKKIMPPSLGVKYQRSTFLRKHPGILELIIQNSEFKDKHSGKRCFIIGNGPSTSSVDFSTLREEYTFTVNQIPRNPRFKELNTQYHIWQDERFFDLDKTREEDLELVSIMKAVNTNGNKPIVFYKTPAKKMIEEFGLIQEVNIRYFACGINKDFALRTGIDYSSVVPDFSTVVHTAICLSVYMGFKEIYLLGCDCTGIISIAQSKLNIAQESEYSYEISKNEKQRMEKVAGLTSFRDEMIWQVDMLDTYKKLYEYCDKYGAKLTNCTDGGLLEGIPRMQLSDVLKKTV